MLESAHCLQRDEREREGGRERERGGGGGEEREGGGGGEERERKQLQCSTECTVLYRTTIKYICT